MENNMKEVKTLTDEEVEQIANVLTDQKSEKDLKLEEIQNLSDEDKKAIILKTNPELEVVEDDEIKDIPYNVMSKSGLIKSQALVEVNPETGEKTVLPDQSGLNHPISEKVGLEELASGEAEDILSELKDENMLKSIQDMDLDISNKEAYMIIEVVRKFESGVEVEFDELPSVLKSMVNGLMLGAAETGEKLSRKVVVADVIKFIAAQLHWDQEVIALQDVLKKELKINSIMDLYTEENDKIMTDKLLEAAQKYEDEGDLVKAKLFRDMSTAYVDAKDFKSIEEAIDSKCKEARRLKRETKRFKNYVRDFNYKYNEDHTKFIIDDLRVVEKVLVRHCGVSIDEARMFLILFCRLTKNMSSSDVIGHTYMYYTLKNITTLDAYDKDDQNYIERKEHLSRLIEKLNNNQ